MTLPIGFSYMDTMNDCFGTAAAVIRQREFKARREAMKAMRRDMRRFASLATPALSK